jgi:hypothetical protein
MKEHRPLPFVAIALALLLGSVAPTLGQEETGNLFITVIDADGAKLPGVTVELEGMGAPRLMVSNASGEVRFLGLDPGAYALAARLEGFSTLEYPGIDIRAARSTSIELELSGAIGEVITVTSESPLLDERKLTAGTTVSQIELEKIPTARDPWSMLTQTPAVLTDRINVGGNESGQQTVFRAPSVRDDENDFQVDGVQITDMAAIGSSPTYYDFDQFSEMQFTTGGSEITRAAAGVSVNLVTKRGTNELRGTARYMLTDGGGYFGLFEQGNPDVESDLAPDQESFEAPEINRIQDYGFEAGGPVVKDKVWLWGAWGRQDIRMFAAGGAPDNTELENTALKLNSQPFNNNSLLASFNNGDKQKFGRGAGRTRPQETTTNQRGPTGVFKVEDTHVFNSNLFMTGTWSKVDGGFMNTSQAVLNADCGGQDCPFELETLVDPEGIYRNSYYQYSASRPSQELKADGSYFISGDTVGHEIKFGARMREVEAITSFTFPGRNLLHFAGENWDLAPGPDDVVIAYRGSWAPTNQDYASIWAQDTLSFGSWTVNAGLRWDVQTGENPALVVAENPAFPEILPSIDFPGNDANGLEWSSITPRIGVTYALGEERNTLIRGSYAQFARALPGWVPGQLNPTGFSYAYFYFEDLNGNNMWDDRTEPFELFDFAGFDPTDPTALSSPNRIDPGLDPEMTQEIILGAEHSLMPEFVLGAQFTFRTVDDILDEARLVRDVNGAVRPETASDYILVGTTTGTLPDGTTVAIPEWNLRPSLSTTGGTLLFNGRREREYMGANVNWTKRLTNGWMMRGYVAYAFQDEWSVPDNYVWGEGGLGLLNNTGLNPSELKNDCDGCLYAVQSLGSGNKGDVFLQSGWSWNLNGMYQVKPEKPWGFNVAANLFGREGFPLPYFTRTGGTIDNITRDISLVSGTDDFRADDIFTFDLRLEKEFLTTNQASITVSLDGFNLLNETYVLQRERQLNLSTAGFVDETLSPRVWRLGMRLNWR